MILDFLINLRYHIIFRSLIRSVMKTRSLLFLIMVAISFSGCKKDKESTTPPELDIIKTSLVLSVDSLNNALTNAAASIAQTGVDNAAVRAKLAELLAGSSFSKEFAFITPLGILQIIEPPAYYPYQGTDLSNGDILTILQNKQPVLTNMFAAVEGFNAVADIHPIVNNTQVMGAIESLFTPDELLGRIIAPLLVGQTFEIWVMENNGMMLYNQDIGEIGHNLFTDTMYDFAPDLRTAAHKIAEGQSGDITYSFYQTGTTTVVKKNGHWVTFTQHGTEWKIVWVKPE